MVVCAIGLAIRRDPMKRWNPLRLTAWRLTLAGLVLAVCVSLGYFELRKQGRADAGDVPPAGRAQSTKTEAAKPSNPTSRIMADPVDLFTERHAETNAAVSGDFHLNRSEYDEAIAAYQEALSRYPSNIDLRRKLANAIAVCKKENALLNAGFRCRAD